MYNDELEAISVPLEALFLDPKNPRFFTEEEARKIGETKIPDEKEQKRAQEKLEGSFGVEELYFSILRNGFLPLDRIVVRPIEGHPEKYVVVEGNRRLAALKLLHRRINENAIAEEGVSEDYLQKLKESTQEVEVLLYKGSEQDISWILQGLRHISGIKDWKPAQQGWLVAQQIEQGMKFREAGQKFGLGATLVGRLYRAYKGLQQMRNDSEYGPKYRDDYFSLFEEAYKNKKVREWLGWDDLKLEFINSNELEQFYSWITPDEENENKRRIHDPKHLRYLSILLEKERQDLIGQIDRYEVEIEVANVRASETVGKYDLEAELKKARNVIESVPIKFFSDHSTELKTKLEELQNTIKNQLRLLDSVVTTPNVEV